MGSLSINSRRVGSLPNKISNYVPNGHCLYYISLFTFFSQTSVTAGDIICFSSSEDEGTKGGWSSDQNSIIRVNEHSGLAQAVGIGHATIRKSLQGSSNQQTTAAVIVEPVQELTFQREVLLFIFKRIFNLFTINIASITYIAIIKY